MARGKEEKKHIVTRYKKGRVWWKDEQVAEWDEESHKMKLLGNALPHQAAFNLLMGLK